MHENPSVMVDYLPMSCLLVKEAPETPKQYRQLLHLLAAQPEVDGKILFLRMSHVLFVG